MQANDYSLSSKQAEQLAAMVVLPLDMRREMAGRLSGDEAREMLAQVLGMANSVVSNVRDWVEIEAITKCDLHPHQVEQINTASMLGACLGARMAAQVKQDGLCEGCALRLGTMANQSVPTIADVDWCEGKGEFCCHMHDDPKPACPGHTRWQALKRATQAA